MSDDAFEAWKLRAREADILDVAGRVGAKLKKNTREWVGPCPRCPKTKDTFGVNPAKRVFICRKAGIGGNVITMVMHACAVEFLAACEIITGEPPPAQGTQLTPEAKAASAKLLADSKANAEHLEAEDNKWRADERRRSAEMYDHAAPFAGSSAEAYFAIRGLTFPPTPEGRAERIKCIEDHPYVVRRKDDAGNDSYDVVHRGPAMVMPIVDADRKQRGLHITYIDLAQPNGKLKLNDPKSGELLDPKKTRGSMQGNRVELIGPREPARMVLGEGAEKVVAVWRAMHTQACAGALPIGGIPLDDTAFWSACNLGNLAGPHVDRITHPTLTMTSATGRVTRQKVAGATPDFDKPGIVIPDSVTDLVLLGDSTSDPFTTQFAMCRAAARYARPGRTVRVAWAPDGKDFDDLWRDLVGRWTDAEVDRLLGEAARQETAVFICGIIQRAEAPTMPAIEAAAPARASTRAPKGAAVVRQETGDGAAGAPAGLPASETDRDEPPDAPVPPPHDAPPGAASAEDQSETSHSGRTGARSANRARWGGPPRKYGEGTGALNKWLAFFPMTELGLIERYVQREKGRLCYCEALGWLWWNGRKWSREGGEAKAIAAGHDTVRAIQDEAEAIRGTDDDVIVSSRIVKHGKGKDATEEEVVIYLSDMLERFGRESETKSAMTLHKHALAYISHEVEDFDADHMLLNIENGTLVFSRAPFAADEPLPRGWVRHNAHIRLKPHDPADLITKLAAMSYKRGALCPLYDASMETWQPEKNQRAFLNVWDGYSLTGDASEQKLALNIGTGKNGKSTWTAVKLKLLGDYGGSVPISTLMDNGKARAAGQASPDLAKLRGIRMLLTSEPKQHWKMDEGLVKDLTGGDKVSVRELNKAYFDLESLFKLTIAGNHKPDISAGDKNSGIWRRLALIYWKVTIAEDLRDLRLVEKLTAESSGILNRWLDGLTVWLQHGLKIPKEVADATEEFRSERDVVGRFFSECTEQHHNNRAGVTLTHETFVAWLKASGESGRHDWTPKGLSNAIKERGYVSVKASIIVWVGFRLTKSPEDFVGSDGKPIGKPASTSDRDAGDPRPEPTDRRDGDDDEGF